MFQPSYTTVMFNLPLWHTYIDPLKQTLGPITFAAPVTTLKLNSVAEQVTDTAHGFFNGLLIPETLITQ